MQARADELGRVTLQLVRESEHVLGLLFSLLAIGGHFAWQKKPAVTNVMVRQIYFTGVQGLPWVVVIALGIGVVSVYNIVDFSRSIQDMSLIGRLISDLLVLEVAPLMVTILLLSRSGVAVVTELGSMHVRGEDLTLKSMGINVAEYLLWPRLFAFTICASVLIFIFIVVSIGAGGILLSLTNNLGFADFLLQVRRGSGVDELVLLTLKSVLYPIICATILLGQGCRVGREPNLIPVHATKGVLGSLVTVLTLDGMIALLRVLL